MRVTPQDVPKEFDPVEKNWEDEKTEEEGTGEALLQGLAEKEEEKADEKDLEADMLEQKAAKEAKETLKVKNKLKANGMPKDNKISDSSQVNTPTTFFIQVPTIPNVIQKNENRIKKELVAAKRRVINTVKNRQLNNNRNGNDRNEKKEEEQHHPFYKFTVFDKGTGGEFLSNLLKKIHIIIQLQLVMILKQIM